MLSDAFSEEPVSHRDMADRNVLASCCARCVQIEIAENGRIGVVLTKHGHVLGKVTREDELGPQHVGLSLSVCSSPDEYKPLCCRTKRTDMWRTTSHCSNAPARSVLCHIQKLSVPCVCILPTPATVRDQAAASTLIIALVFVIGVWHQGKGGKGKAQRETGKHSDGNCLRHASDRDHDHDKTRRTIPTHVFTSSLSATAAFAVSARRRPELLSFAVSSSASCRSSF